MQNSCQSLNLTVIYIYNALHSTVVTEIAHEFPTLIISHSHTYIQYTYIQARARIQECNTNKKVFCLGQFRDLRMSTHRVRLVKSKRLRTLGCTWEVKECLQNFSGGNFGIWAFWNHTIKVTYECWEVHNTDSESCSTRRLHIMCAVPLGYFNTKLTTICSTLWPVEAPWCSTWKQPWVTV